MTIGRNGQPCNYEVIISEYQRKMFVGILQAVALRPEMVEFMKTQPGETTDSMFDEFEMMAGMLNDLPEHELSSPGVMHGLCL